MHFLSPGCAPPLQDHRRALLDPTQLVVIHMQSILRDSCYQAIAGKACLCLTFDGEEERARFYGCDRHAIT